LAAVSPNPSAATWLRELTISGAGADIAAAEIDSAGLLHADNAAIAKTNIDILRI
jgi:hypothetical protein